MSFIDSTLAVGSAALGVGLLRASWSRRGPGSWLTTAGWLAFLGGALAWHVAGLGWDEAIALAMLGPCLIAYGILARQAGWSAAVAGATRAGQPGKSRRAVKRLPATPEAAQSRGTVDIRLTAEATSSAAAESAPPASLGRGAARALLAGPLALAAALGLTDLIALRMPWLEADRLVTAGFLLPIAWAAGAIWATMDSKLTRVAVALSLTAIVCVSGAVA